jgi:large repetitive protein
VDRRHFVICFAAFVKRRNALKRTLLLLLVAVAVGCLPLIASAQDGGFNAQLFRPSIFGGNFVAIEDANVLCPLGFGGGLIVNYANGVLEWRIDEERDTGVLNQLVTADALLAFAPFSFMSMGVDVPVHLYTRGRPYEDSDELFTDNELSSESSLGDVRAEIKFRLLQQEKHWIGMALAPFGTFATGDDTLFLGEGRTTGGGILALERDLKIFNLGLNGGYHYRGDEEVGGVNMGDAWKAGAGISRDFGGLSFSVEYQGLWIDSGSVDDIQANPMEAFGTLRYKFGENGPRLIAGGSGGMTSGVGSPAYRVIAGIDYYHCCPDVSELLVTVVDTDGVPLTATVDITGPLAQISETDSTGKWTDEVESGSYKVKASKAGYTADSGEVEVPEGKLGQIVLTLAPIPTKLSIFVKDKKTLENIPANSSVDNGKALDLPDGTFAGEWEPGTFSMTVTSEGYQDKTSTFDVAAYQENQVTVLMLKKIKKIDKIYFDFDSDVLRKESYVVLDDIYSQIIDLPAFGQILIEGHCSSEGTDAYNMNLSKRRALSVKKYLVNKGLNPAKLQVMPYGEDRPIASNDNEEGREQNRRSEFIIEE